MRRPRLPRPDGRRTPMALALPRASELPPAVVPALPHEGCSCEACYQAWLAIHGEPEPPDAADYHPTTQRTDV